MTSAIKIDVELCILGYKIVRLAYRHNFIIVVCGSVTLLCGMYILTTESVIQRRFGLIEGDSIVIASRCLALLNE